ncbi:MAG TPA: GNAT family N-acetyltransferase [Thermoanaerobaculia bacterium]
MSEISARADHAVFVDTAGDSVTGFIHVCVMLSLEGDSYAEVRALVVDEAHRGGGAGPRLVAAAEQWARERQQDRVRVRSNVVRERARRFYERLGYAVVKTQNVLDRTL